jgi:hypothetical protein
MMSFLKELKSWLGMDPDSVTLKEQVSDENPLFVYVKIPGNIQPLERATRFEDPVQEALSTEKLGEITGGGSQLADEETSTISFCGLDVELYEVERGIALLRRELVRLKAPKDTFLLYEVNGEEFEDPLYLN